MTRPVMFLRTAQTEQRITDLEEKMAMVLAKLGMIPPSPNDEEWEAAAPPIEKLEPQAAIKPPSKIAQKVAKGR